MIEPAAKYGAEGQIRANFPVSQTHIHSYMRGYSHFARRVLSLDAAKRYDATPKLPTSAKSVPLADLSLEERGEQ